MTPQAMLRKDLKTGKAIETLQHRHYATIAAIIAELPPGQRDMITVHFARHLNRNPRFDETRFIAACLSQDC